jgi:Na+-translocating ferredoxin:NAD+ oxidoreductase subunit G
MENSKKTKNTIVKDALALFLITLIAGLSLGYVYQITKEPIKNEQLRAKQESYQTVFSDAITFDEDSDLSEVLIKEAPGILEGSDLAGALISEVLLAKDQSSNQLGYVLSITSKEGYGGDINISLGISNDGMITGMEILSMSETAGLGANAGQDKFKKQFYGIQDQVVYTKTGKLADNEIDVISGATITTKAVTNAVNAGLSFVKNNSWSASK